MKYGRSLENIWNKLTKDVVIDKKLVEETMVERMNCLIGKVLMEKVVNMEAMRTVLYKVWKFSGDVKITETGKVWKVIGKV